MLEHQIKVLKAVSDNQQLFRKELIKSLSWLSDKERLELQKWVSEHYMNQYPGLINEAFGHRPAYA